jgi:hypothetical protein
MNLKEYNKKVDGLAKTKKTAGKDLEPDDDRKRKVELLGGVDDTLGNDVALHDASEDVDEDGLDLGVA